jgi:hypothetical protein
VPDGITEGVECPVADGRAGGALHPSSTLVGDLATDTPKEFVLGANNAMDVPEAVPINWETGMTTSDSGKDPRRSGFGIAAQEFAQRLEGSIERRASGRIRDLHVVCSDDSIILQGRSRTYHAKQLAQQAVLDLTDGHPVLTNQIVVC